MIKEKIVNYEIELIINENLYNKEIITKDIYIKTKEKLLKLIELTKTKNIKLIDTS